MNLLDGLKNFITGLGGRRDRTTTTSFDLSYMVTDAELNAMHRGDWLARKIVDIIPNDMTREWRNWQAKKDQITAIETLEKSPLVNLQSKVNQAMRMARLLRGSAIYIGLIDDPSQPIDLDRIKKDDLQYLNVISKRHISIGPINKDAGSEFYGEPEYYDLRGLDGATLRIHPSRIVRFIGAEILDEDENVEGWGDSVLQVVYNAVQNAASSQQHVAGLIQEAKTDVMYIPNLNTFLRSDSETAQLTKRFGYASSIKSQFNMTLLEGTGGTGPNDGGERWEQKQINFSQLPELMRQFLSVACAAADVPITRMMGESPGGLNASGDSDTRNYYDNLSSRQKTELTPQLQRLDEIIIRSALGSRPAEIFYEWAPLWGLSEKEKADIFSTKATAGRTLAGTGAIPPLINIEALSEALTNEFIEDGSLSGLEASVEKFGPIEEPLSQEELIAAKTPKPVPGSNVVPIKKPATTTRAKDATPRSLYVRRDVVNVDEITTWAKRQGFASVVSGMHVTIAYSKAAIDWMKIDESWSNGDSNGQVVVRPGGPRLVEPFGSAVVLLFSSTELQWRHMAIREAGASFDYAEYQPHVSITYEPGDVDLTTVEPYRGAIVLGPEVFEEIGEDYKSGIVEN